MKKFSLLKASVTFFLKNMILLHIGKMENDHSRKYDIALDVKSLDCLDHQCFYPLTLF